MSAQVPDFRTRSAFGYEQGVIIGVPSALALTRLMGGMLSGLPSTDPVTYIAVVGMLLTSALLASYLPARRATRVDPIVALRTE